MVFDARLEIPDLSMWVKATLFYKKSQNFHLLEEVQDSHNGISKLKRLTSGNVLDDSCTLHNSWNINKFFISCCKTQQHCHGKVTALHFCFHATVTPEECFSTDVVFFGCSQHNIKCACCDPKSMKFVGTSGWNKNVPDLKFCYSYSSVKVGNLQKFLVLTRVS